MESSDNNIPDSEQSEWINKARSDFSKYCNNSCEKMTLEEFLKFYNEFFADFPASVRAKFPPEQFFKEFATTNKNKDLLEKEEFEQVWEELNLFRTETRDSI